MKKHKATNPGAGLLKRDCDLKAPQLKDSDIKALLPQLKGKWKLKGRKLLERRFEFADFKGALKFTNQVGKIAEKQQHHPDFFLTYGEVRLQLSTHHAGGLTENDFIMAARINALK